MFALSPGYTLRAALLVLALVACSDDDPAEPPPDTVDAAGGDAGPCRPTDCAPIIRPSLRCDAGVPQFTCGRGLTNRCEWQNPTCSVSLDAPGGSTDASAPAGEAGTDNEASPGDPVDAGDDAVDAGADGESAG